MEKLEKTAAALRRRGFDAAIFETAKEAADYLLSDMPAGETVGFGGCMTAKQMGLETLLRANGHKVLWHWETPKPERPGAAARSHERAAVRLFRQRRHRGRPDGADRRHRQPRRRDVLRPPARYMCSSAATKSSPAAMRRRSNASRKSPARRTRAASISIPMCRNGGCNPARCEESMVPRHGGV